MNITFTVHGTPITQGSKRAIAIGGKARVIESAGSRLTAWRHAIATEARNARNGHDLLSGPVGVSAAFMLQRPASHPKRRRTWPIGARSGDVDKQARAALDAITGVLIADDSQVVDLHVTKDYGDPAVRVTVWQVTE